MSVDNKIKMSIWLKILLALFVFANISSLYLYLVNGYSSMRHLYPTIPDYNYQYKLVDDILSIIFIVEIFRLSRWSIPTFTILYIIRILINILLPTPLILHLVGLVGLGLYIILIIPVWKNLNKTDNIAP